MFYLDLYFPCVRVLRSWRFEKNIRENIFIWFLRKVWCERLCFSHVFCSNKNAQFSWKYLSRFGQRKNPFHLFLKDLYCEPRVSVVITTFFRVKYIFPTKIIFQQMFRFQFKMKILR